MFLVLILALSLSSSNALQVNEPKRIAVNNKVFDRRFVLEKGIRNVMIGSASMMVFNEPVNAIDGKTKAISDLLESNIVTMAPPSRNSEFQGVDNTYFPSWMAGEWELTQTLEKFDTPLGNKFVGGPNASEDIAEKTINEQKKKIGVPVDLKVRWVNTKFGVCEDRKYNLRQRLDAFAERKVVASVEYADVGGSNRKSVIALGGGENDPLQTTMVYFKGPAAQKTFLLSHSGELSKDGKAWVGFETTRSIFALTNTNTAPPITTDSELIWSLKYVDEENVIGRLRLCDFLNAQNDKLFFDAKNRAVSISDYSLKLKKAKVSDVE